MYSGEYTRTFTTQAAQALAAAQQEAQQLHHNYIGTEHLLLGLLDIPTSHAAQALQRAGVCLEKARLVVAKLTGKYGRYVHWQIGLTTRAKEAIEHAVIEMKGAGEHMIDTEHLLLALLHQEGTLVREVLRQLKVDPLALSGLLHQKLDQPVRISGNLLPSLGEQE